MARLRRDDSPVDYAAEGLADYRERIERGSDLDQRWLRAYRAGDQAELDAVSAERERLNEEMRRG